MCLPNHQEGQYVLYTAHISMQNMRGTPVEFAIKAATVTVTPGYATRGNAGVMDMARPEDAVATPTTITWTAEDGPESSIDLYINLLDNISDCYELHATCSATLSLTWRPTTQESQATPDPVACDEDAIDVELEYEDKWTSGGGSWIEP